MMEQLTFRPQEAASVKSPEATNPQFVQSGDIVSFPTSLLSPRQSQVLSLVAEGYTSKGIGLELGLRPKTVENHRSAIIKKLNTPSLAGAVAIATQYEVIESSEKVEEPLEKLSSREKEILNLVATGSSTKEIGQALSLRPKTIENYRANILSKLQATSSAQAVKIGLTYGVVDGSSITPPPLPEPSNERDLALSPRRQQILIQAAQGASAKGIADALGIAPKTVEVHLDLIRKQYGARTTTEALVRSLVSGDLSIDLIAPHSQDEIKNTEIVETVKRSVRVLEVLELASIGYTAKEIGNHLKLSLKTVEHHAAKALKLVDAVNMPMAVMKAISLGILSLEQLKSAMENGVDRNESRELPSNTTFDSNHLSNLAAD